MFVVHMRYISQSSFPFIFTRLCLAVTASLKGTFAQRLRSVGDDEQWAEKLN